MSHDSGTGGFALKPLTPTNVGAGLVPALTLVPIPVGYKTLAYDIEEAGGRNNPTLYLLAHAHQ